MAVVEAMPEEDRVQLCGSKHARVPGRLMVRGGTVRGELVLGGRPVSVRRPRVRRVDGGEVELRTFDARSGQVASVKEVTGGQTVCAGATGDATTNEYDPPAPREGFP